MLIDSNILILSFLAKFTLLRQFIVINVPFVSAITYVETLGFHRLSPKDRRDLEEYFTVAPVLPITQEILDAAVSLRQQRKIGLGDSLIAATCVVHGITLVTQNTTDFQWIQGLNLHNPFVVANIPPN